MLIIRFVLGLLLVWATHFYLGNAFDQKSNSYEIPVDVMDVPHQPGQSPELQHLKTFSSEISTVQFIFLFPFLITLIAFTCKHHIYFLAALFFCPNSRYLFLKNRTLLI